MLLQFLERAERDQSAVDDDTDTIGQALGQSEAKTRAILESSLGSVLVIDEAYGLYAPAGATNVYAEAVIETLVATVQGVPGDDRAVLLLGYKEPMERMMREANPGLARCGEIIFSSQTPGTGSRSYRAQCRRR